MDKSKVYFTNLRTKSGYNLQQKLEKLIESAGIGSINFKDKFTAIKIHFGEPGNLSYLRPNYAKTVADYVKKKQGKPFLTDCNTLYVGRRSDGLNHLEAAYENGFSPFSTNCHVIIGDGIKGNDEKDIDVDGIVLKSAKIGTAIAESDIIISLNHFKGHEATGFGGALKNLGMGCGSRAGKKIMHDSGKASVVSANCKKCGRCSKVCAHSAIQYNDELASIVQDRCVGCARCIEECPFNAIVSTNENANNILNMKIAEYTKAVIQDKPSFHINLVMDVSPNCDCHSENDLPIVNDIGMFASFDPVALDMACIDMVNKQTPIPNSHLADNINKNTTEKMDNLFLNHPDTNWKTAISHAVKIGVGTDKYELIEI